MRGETFPVARIYSASAGPAQYPQAAVQIDAGFDLVGGGALVEPVDPAIGSLLVENMPIPSGWSAQSKDHTVVCPSKITTFAIAIKQK